MAGTPTALASWWPGIPIQLHLTDFQGLFWDLRCQKLCIVDVAKISGKVEINQAVCLKQSICMHLLGFKPNGCYQNRLGLSESPMVVEMLASPLFGVRVRFATHVHMQGGRSHKHILQRSSVGDRSIFVDLRGVALFVTSLAYFMSKAYHTNNYYHTTRHNSFDEKSSHICKLHPDENPTIRCYHISCKRGKPKKT